MEIICDISSYEEVKYFLLLKGHYLVLEKTFIIYNINKEMIQIQAVLRGK